MTKVHFHTDCPFFAGCENMLSVFFGSDEFLQKHKVSFSYRSTALYEEGLSRRVQSEIPTYPLYFPNLSALTDSSLVSASRFRSVIGILARLAFTAPVFLYETIVLFFLLRKVRPDVLHINNGGYPGALSARAAAVAGALACVPATVMVVNNMAEGYTRIPRILGYPLDRLTAMLIGIFITGSEMARRRLNIVLRLDSKQTRSVHNAVELRDALRSVEQVRQELGLSSFDGIVFGVVALLIPRKGHIVLLESVAQIIKEKRLPLSGIRVMIEGEGPLHEQLVEFVKTNDLQEIVHFVGHQDDIVGFMKTLDVVILPSVRDEDFPNVVLESMALGKPVICSRLAGTPEQVVDGKTGILVEPGDRIALSDTICGLAEDSVKLSAMGVAALKRYQTNFATTVILDKYSKLYQQLLEKRSKRI